MTECDIVAIEKVVGKLSGIYGVQAGPGGAVKIGKTADVRDRVRSLQTAHPETLCIVYFEWCTNAAERKRTEKSLHKKFAAHRLQGEWFSAEILSELEELQESPDIVRCRVSGDHGLAVELLTRTPRGSSFRYQELGGQLLFRWKGIDSDADRDLDNEEEISMALLEKRFVDAPQELRDGVEGHVRAAYEALRLDQRDLIEARRTRSLSTTAPPSR